MTDYDVISLSSDSSRPSSPFINVSEVFNITEKNSNQSLATNLESSLNTARTSSPLTLNTTSPPYNLDEMPSTSSNWPLKSSPLKSRVVHTLSDSEGSDKDEVNTNSNTFNMLYQKYCQTNSSANLGLPCTFKSSSSKGSQSSSTPETDLKELGGKQSQETRKRKNGCRSKSDSTKEQRLQEKLKRQTEKEGKKAEKLAALELKKRMKPENCVKFMTVNVDSSLINCSFGGTLLAAVQNSESRHNVTPQAVPNSITWTRELPGSTFEDEEDLILLWEWQQVIPAIKSNTLTLKIKECQEKVPNKTVSLVVYGLNGYFTYLKSKRKNLQNDGVTSKRARTDQCDYPYLTRKEIEEGLIELQILANCNHRLIESAEELGQLIVQITKAIAEKPFKLEKQKRELENLEWFAVGDSRDCVIVDKDGNGLLRLWHQQLCQFNLASHDTAQAIAMHYPSPQALLQAYNRCSSKKEGEELLKDIQIRRTQGPLQSCRRIGPELSKKIYTFFCSQIGEAPLSQEQ